MIRRILHSAAATLLAVLLLGGACAAATGETVILVGCILAIVGLYVAWLADRP